MKKLVIGRLLSFWEGQMSVFGRAYIAHLPLCFSQAYSFETTSLWVNPERSVYVDATEVGGLPYGVVAPVLFYKVWCIGQGHPKPEAPPKMAKKTGKTSGFNYSSRLVEVTQANLGIVCDDFVPGLKLVWLESLEMFMCFFLVCAQLRRIGNIYNP